MNRTEQDILYLAGCAMHQIKPDVEGMDFDKIANVAMHHTLSSMICMALESAGVKIDILIDQKNKAIRKNMMLDNERHRIFSKLDEVGIWHMPLKGILLKDMYPSYGMRQMADNDILFDPKFRNEVRDIFLSLDYEIEEYGNGNHDVYLRKPIFNYEMHVSLFSKVFPDFFKYYTELEKKYICDGYERCMNVNDAYVYIVAHAYKHFTLGGTGIRTLMDLYMYNEHCKNAMNKDYIYEQCKILDIQEFEEEARKIAYKIFDHPTRDFSFLSQEEDDYIKYYFTSGTYGTSKQRIQNEIHKIELNGSNHAKAKYLLRRIFPKISWFRQNIPCLNKYPVFIPFYALIRPFIKAFTSRKKWINEVKTVRESK